MNRLRRIRAHFNRHRFAYGVGTGLTISGYFVIQRAETWNEFLDEHGLLEEFYEFEA